MAHFKTTTQMKYLSKNNYGYYSFRIKVPQPYRSYFNQTEIIKSLKTKSYNEARKLCTLLTSETKKLLQTLKLGVFSKEQEISLVDKYVSKVLGKSLETLFIDGDIEEKVKSDTNITEVKKEQGKSLEEIVRLSDIS